MNNNSIEDSKVRLESHPHVDIMGVEISKQDLTWHIDWLTVTIHGVTVDDFQDFWVAWFDSYFGKLVDQEHGGRFYKKTHRAGMGVTFRSDPGRGDDYATLEIPGQACQLLGFEKLQQIYKNLKFVFGAVVVKRLDTAFDNCPFEVMDAYKEVESDNIRSFFKRENLHLFNDPFQKRENGVVGCHGFTIGGRSSSRFMRVYDKHGSTRLEIEYKEEKAVQVAEDLFSSQLRESAKLAIGHVRDYIDFFAPWWDKFTAGIERLYKKIVVTAKEVELAKVSSWIVKQVSAALSLVADGYKEDFISSVIELGRVKREKNPRYKIALSLIGV